MSNLLSPSEIEARANARGKVISEVCREAGVAPSTFSRWKAGKTTPSIKVYEALEEATRPTERGA